MTKVRIYRFSLVAHCAKILPITDGYDDSVTHQRQTLQFFIKIQKSPLVSIQ